MNMRLTIENIDRVVAMCNLLIREHVKGDTETLMIGVELMGQMAKRCPDDEVPSTLHTRSNEFLRSKIVEMESKT